MFDHERLIAAETDRFADVLRDADPKTPVPSCPEWSADDLLWHLTDVHAFWARILRSGALTDDDSEAAEADKPARPDTREKTFALLVTETDSLIGELARRRDDQPAWSWFASAQNVGFTRRMQVHEATMHRVDAELAAGLPVSPIDPEVAADAIAHAIEVMLSWWGTLDGFTFTPVADIVELSTTDLDRSWLLEPGRWRGVGTSGRSYDEPGLRIVAEGTPVASVTGTTNELARWLWGRGAEPAAAGDDDALAALREAQAQGMN